MSISYKIHSKRLSKEGFQPLAGNGTGNMHFPTPSHMIPPPQPDSYARDVTIDIPMTTVTSPRGQTGARKATFPSSPSTCRPTPDFPTIYDEKKSTFGPGGRRRKIQAKGVENKDHDDGALTAAGKLYSVIFNFSVVTRYFLYVAPLAIAIAAPIVIGATAAPNAKIAGVRMTWFFSWVEIVWCSLWISKLFSQFLPHLFQFLCGVVSSGTRKYASVISALEIPLSLVGWALCALTTFVPLMTLNPDQRRLHDTAIKPWETTVQNILWACWSSTVVFLAEKLIIQLISISYHRKQFDAKIQRSKHNVHLISILYDASRALFPAYCPEFAEEDYEIGAMSLSVSRGKSHESSAHTRSGSATPMRIMQDVGRIGDKVTAAFGNVAHEITGKQVFNPTSAHSIVVEAMEKKSSSEALARRLWMSFVIEGRDALYREDIVDVLGPEHAAEAEEAFHCLDVDGNGDISLDEMIFRITEFGRERFSIATSMHDVDYAIRVLDNLLCTVVLILVVFIFVAFLNKSFTTTLATAGTALLSLSFVFSVTAQEVLGSCIFLFVKHPFDVGDRVDIAGEQLLVERISLLYTIFRKVKDHKTTQVANIVLNTVWIDNISRSKSMREQLFLYIHFDTTLDEVQLLKNEIQTFVRDKDNSRDFEPDVDVEVTGLAEMNKMELKVEIRHKSNWSNEAIRAARRSKFMCALVLALRKVPIYGPGMGGAPAGDPANPMYSVAISDEVAAANKMTFASDKDKKRMVPPALSPAKGEQSMSPVAGQSSSVNLLHIPGLSPNSMVVENLHHRRPVGHPTDDAATALVRPSLPTMNSEEAAVQRASHVEEVRTILHADSVNGRRKRTQTVEAPAVLPVYDLSLQQASSSPFPPDPSPASSRPAARVSYYEENAFTAPPPRSESRNYVRGNAFAQQHSSPPSFQPQSQQQDNNQSPFGTTAPKSRSAGQNNGGT